MGAFSFDLFLIRFAHLVFRRHEEGGTVLLAEFRFLDLAGGISGYFGEDDPAGAFITGKFSAVGVDFLFGAGMALFSILGLIAQLTSPKKKK